MDFLVKIAETGVSYSYSKVPNTDKVINLQTRIRNDTRIEIKDQVLITKTGYRIQHNEILSNLEKDNQLQTTIAGSDNPLKSGFVLYLFDQKKYSEKPSSKDRHNPYFADISEGLKNYLLESKIIEKDYTADFQSQTTDSNVIENIKTISPEILNTDNKLFNYHSTMKKKFLQYKSKVKRLEKLIEENENQIQTYEVLLKHASSVYNPYKDKKKKLEEKFAETEIKNQGSLQKFEEGINNLSKIELHEALKSEKHKFLIDIYYNTDAMYKWKNSCLESQNTVKNKIEKSGDLIKSIKEKLWSERDKTQQLIKTQIQNNHESREVLSQGNEASMASLVKKSFEEYQSLRETLEGYEETKKETITNSKWASGDLKEWEEADKMFTKNLEKIDRGLDQINKAKMCIEAPLIIFYNNIMRFVSDLNMLSLEKMKKLNEDVEKLEKDFSYLLNPSHLPGAYNAALVEVSRRREFHTIFDRKYKELKGFVDTELDKRLRFLAQFGKILPSDFIPQLKNKAPLLVVENADTDADLPAIDGLHTSTATHPSNPSQPASEPSVKTSRDEDARMIQQLEKQVKEYTAEIQRLKGEDAMKNLKKRMDDLAQDFERERDRNKILKSKLNDMEKQQLNSSLRKEITKDDAINKRENEELKRDFDLLTQMVDKCLSSVNSKAPNGDAGNKKENVLEKQQLVHKVESLTAMIEQVSKTSYGIFSRQLNDKQKRFDDVKMKYEGLLMKAEESLQKTSSRIESHYEDKLKDLNKNFNEAQTRITVLMAESNKFQKEISAMKADSYEKAKHHQHELENIKKDVKIKLELLKSKDEIIRSLNDMKINLAKEISEFPEKLRKLEQTMKTNHTEAVANIHNLHKSEIDTFKARIKNLDRDISNKNIELDKLEYDLNQSKKESKQKDDQIGKLEGTVASLNERITKMVDEIAGYKNKIDNMELTLQKKTNELNIVNKTVNQLTSDKNSLSNDLSTYKEFNGELTRKMQSVNELWKKSEGEKKNFKNEADNLKLELEKKQVEIQNLSEQVGKVTKERKEQVDELNKITEDHQTERMKITSLQEELNQKNIEINTLKTKLDILSLDLDNKVRENKHLLSKVESLENEKEKIETDLQKGKKDLDDEKTKLRETEQRMEDLRVVCEQIQIEMDAKVDKCESLKRNVQEATERAEKAEKSLTQANKESETARKEDFEKVSQADTKVQEMKARIMQLEEELRQKAEEIREKDEEVQSSGLQKAKVEEEIKSLVEQYDKEKKEGKVNEEEITNSNQKIIEEYNKQEESYKQEVLNKQTEVDELQKKNEELVSEADQLKQEKFLLNSELSSKKSELELVVKDFKSQALSKLDYLKIEKGAKLLFIPYAPGIYVPFILHQYMQHEIDSVLKNGTLTLDSQVFKNTEKAIKPSFFLDLESLSENYQNILQDCSLLIVGTVGEIKSRIYKEINEKEESSMIKLESIEYMVGFDDEEMILKNYAITLN